MLQVASTTLISKWFCPGPWAHNRTGTSLCVLRLSIIPSQPPKVRVHGPIRSPPSDV